MTRGTRVVVLADPLRGFGVIDGFELDGRLLVRFEARDAVAEWEPPDELTPFHAHELEVADEWKPSLTDDDLSDLLKERGSP